MNLDRKNMVEYLKKVIQIEKATYIAENAVSNARKACIRKEIEKKEVERKDASEMVPKPIPPKEEKLVPEFYPRENSRVLWVLMWVLLGGASFIGWISFSISFYIGVHYNELDIGATIRKALPLVLLTAGALVGAFIDNRVKKKNKQIKYEIDMANIKKAEEVDRMNESIKKEYQNSINQWQKKIDELDNQYQLEYEKECSIRDAEYKRECAIALQNLKTAQNEVKMLEEGLNASFKTREEIYGLSVLYPKYRNWVAVSTFCEYFESGRVSTLEGPDGAYNLYESELRQNLIINRLEKIVDDLEQIKNNQYILYTELKDTKGILEGVSKSITDIVESSKIVALGTIEGVKYSRITAINSAITAANTEVLAYLNTVTAVNSMV